MQVDQHSWPFFIILKSLAAGKFFIKKSKKYAAHDENNQFKVGDIVKIEESRPYSKTKTWTVISHNA